MNMCIIFDVGFFKIKQKTEWFLIRYMQLKYKSDNLKLKFVLILKFDTNS